MKNVINIQNQFGEYLLNYIKSKVANVEDAEDIYQEVIIKIIEKSDQLQKSQSLKSWLFTIAKNRIIDYYRAKRYGVDIEEIKIPAEDEEHEDAYQELQGCLNSFIERLPTDYKKIIVQSEIEGKSQKEISENLDINYVTLRSKVQRGRTKIKNMIIDACVIEKDVLGRVTDCNPNPASPGCSSSSSSCS